MKVLFTCIIISLSAMTFAQSDGLKLASDVWPPFTNVKGEKSFAFDLVKEALARTQVKATLEIVAFENVIPGIQDGQFAGSAVIWKNSARQQFLHYSAPYMENQLVLVGTKGMDVSATSLAELKGKSVAIVASYSYGDAVDTVKGVSFVQGKSDQDNFQDLLKGTVDYILVDALLIQYLITYQAKEVARFLDIGTYPLVRRSLYLALGKNVANAEEIINQFNEEIKKMIADGTYSRILQLNWVRADVDGDGYQEMVLTGNQAGKIAPTGCYSVVCKENPTTNPNRYYIDGNLYLNWETVPEKFKLAPAEMRNAEESGFGLRFNL